jgi:transcriptional regulator with XRE-family HTH domain
MKRSNANASLPRSARKALVKLGHDIALARKKRRISTVSMAERAFISRNTLHKLEYGEPTVSIGIYATVLALLGLAERLGDVADRRGGALGLDLDEEALPSRTGGGPRRSS